MMCMKAEGVDSSPDATPEPAPASARMSCLAEILVRDKSPGSMPAGVHIVIVMDALREFSIEPLIWALDNVIKSGYTVTLLGVMPWVPLALSCKPMDVWTFDFGDLSTIKGRSELKNDPKYYKLQQIIELCEDRGVVPLPYIKVATGYPLRLVVLEKATNLHATLVVLDRALRKNRAFYAERLPSSVVIMNSEGGVDTLKIQSAATPAHDQGTPAGESPATLPTPEVIFSQDLLSALGRVQSFP